MVSLGDDYFHQKVHSLQPLSLPLLQFHFCWLLPPTTAAQLDTERHFYIKYKLHNHVFNECLQHSHNCKSVDWVINVSLILFHFCTTIFCFQYTIFSFINSNTKRDDANKIHRTKNDQPFFPVSKLFWPITVFTIITHINAILMLNHVRCVL